MASKLWKLTKSLSNLPKFMNSKRESQDSNPGNLTFN